MRIRDTLQSAGGFLLITGLAFGFYTVSGREVNSWSHARHFVHLAGGFLDGKLDFGYEPFSTVDMTVIDGVYYVAFPPMPALVTLPFVAIWGTDLDERILSHAIAGLNVALAWLLLGRLWFSNSAASRIALAGFLGFGTVHWYNAVSGAVWYFAHIVAMFFLLLHITETLGKSRPVLTGLSLGAAGLARTSIFFGFPMYILVQYQRSKTLAQSRKAWVVNSLIFLMVLGLSGGFLLFYNYLRFDSPWDFGYRGMSVAGVLQEPLNKYGLFHPHFLAKNAFYCFLAWPRIPAASPFYPQPDHWGTGLLIISPAIGYALAGIRRNAIVLGALLAALLVAIPNLLYYNTGWMQFGYRFALDFIPFLLVPMAVGMRGKISKLAILLILLSIVANYYGLHWFFKIPIFGLKIWLD